MTFVFENWRRRLLSEYAQAPTASMYVYVYSTFFFLGGGGGESRFYVGVEFSCCSGNHIYFYVHSEMHAGA